MDKEKWLAEVIKTADRLARRMGHRFIPDPEKLREVPR